MNSSTFFVVLIITMLSLLFLGIVILFIYYKQQLEIIKKKTRRDSLIPTSLNEVKQLKLSETKFGRQLMSELPKPIIPSNELEGMALNEVMGFFRKKVDLTRIVFWGPIGSGKSSLFNSFSASIYKYYQLSDVAYQLFDSSYEFSNPFKTPYMGNPTTDTREELFIFSRQFYKEKKGAKVSSHLHEILLIDNPGGWLMSAVDDLPDENQWVREKILRSNGIIVTLDPTFDRQPRADYTGYIIKLVNLVKTINTVHYWAFCLTKMDLYPKLINNEPWDVLRELFGQELHNFLKSYTPANQIEVFITSAFGFTKDNEPNTNGWTLANQEEWEPINVEFPFFWIFEKLEMERLVKVKTGMLGKNSLAEYIRYPVPQRRPTKRPKEPALGHRAGTGKNDWAGGER